MKTMEAITRENCGSIIVAIIEKENLTLKRVARAIGCPEASLYRIIVGHSLPSEEMLKQIGLLSVLGFKKYEKLSKAEKEKISDLIGAVGGGAVGFAVIGAAVGGLGGGAAGAAGIAAGLAALGKVVGGGMLAGVGVAAGIPVALAATVYGAVKGVKHIIENYKLQSEGVDTYWEEMRN